MLEENRLDRSRFPRFARDDQRIRNTATHESDGRDGRVDRGLYRLGAKGNDALANYPDLVEHYPGLLGEKSPGA